MLTECKHSFYLTSEKTVSFLVCILLAFLFMSDINFVFFEQTLLDGGKY